MEVALHRQSHPLGFKNDVRGVGRLVITKTTPLTNVSLVFSPIFSVGTVE